MGEPKGSPTPPPFHVMLFVQGIAEPGGYGGCIPHFCTGYFSWARSARPHLTVISLNYISTVNKQL